MKCRSYSLFDHTVVALGFGYMIVDVGVVHLDVEFVPNRIQKWLVLLITMDYLDGKTCRVVSSKYCVQCTPVN